MCCISEKKPYYAVHLVSSVAAVHPDSGHSTAVANLLHTSHSLEVERQAGFFFFCLFFLSFHIKLTGDYKKTACSYHNWNLAAAWRLTPPI